MVVIIIQISDSTRGHHVRHNKKTIVNVESQFNCQYAFEQDAEKQQIPIL